MTPTRPSTFSELVNVFLGLIDLLVVLIFALAFVVMAYKLLGAWVLYPDNETKREEGKAIAITAVLVMFVMLSLWGIIRIFQNGIFG